MKLVLRCASYAAVRPLTATPLQQACVLKKHPLAGVLTQFGGPSAKATRQIHPRNLQCSALLPLRSLRWLSIEICPMLLGVNQV